jgi:hypothetical protein
MATERRSGAPKGIRAYLVQVAVLTNHQNGRDTHVRQIKIYGPRKCVASCVHRMRVAWAVRCVLTHTLVVRWRRDMLQATGHGGLTSVEFSQYATIR